MGKGIKFRPATFYLGIADMLAREVEGQEDQDEVDHEDGEFEKPKVGPGIELEEHPGRLPTGEGRTTASCRSKPPPSNEGTSS